MSPFKPYKIMRNGNPLPGSPFLAKEAYKPSMSGRSYEVVPRVSMENSPRFLLFKSKTVPIQSGDFVITSDGLYGRIINPRHYPSSLQCDLQIIPYVNVHLWTPNKVVNSQIPGSLNISDVTYSDGGQILAYLEPMNDTERVSHFGRLDIRSNRAFTTTPLVGGAVLVDAAGDCWISQTASDVWPVTGDARATMIHLVNPPAGVKV